MKAFKDKGRFSRMMKEFPVKVIMNDSTAHRGQGGFLAGPWSEGKADLMILALPIC